MKTIKLTQGKVTVVDDDVYEWASKFKWYAFKKRNGFYAVRTVNTRSVFLHTAIMQPTDGFEVDHWDGDGLNNLRGNLRTATHQQNTQAYNTRRRGKSSVYRGVRFVRSKYTLSKPWEAQIGTTTKALKNYTPRKYLGHFATEEAAARAYDAAAIKNFGEFAQLNFPIKL